jgi:cytosine/adenosine deaminase-related metal-dependent hydrolase
VTVDLVLDGGRVVDPATGVDAVRNVGISGDRVSVVTADPIRSARRRVDVGGLVVAPGFVDLHSHANSIAGHRLQALDGVTTALDLEAGRSPVEAGYRRARDEGRPLNYGFSASWAAVRMAVLADVAATGRLETLLANLNDPAWQRPADPTELATIVDRLAADIDAGALGIGLLMGYAQEVDPREYVDVARLSVATGTATYTHARDLVEDRPDVLIDGATEVVRTAAETGARMHYCHVNSTSRRHLDRVLELVARARSDGATVSTEAYPYGAGMTAIGAAFLAPERLPHRGLAPDSIVYAPTGERVADAARLAELRRSDPGGLAIVENLDEDEPADRRYLLDALTFPGAVIASDAMPITWRTRSPDPTAWPLGPDAVTHPRSAGTYARSLRWLVRETRCLSLADFVERAALIPTRLLAGFAPAMRRKGSVRPGFDADLVVFDPDRLTDQATYAASTRPSTGVHHTLVNGVFVVRDRALVVDALPGRAVRAGG